MPSWMRIWDRIRIAGLLAWLAIFLFDYRCGKDIAASFFMSTLGTGLWMARGIAPHGAVVLAVVLGNLSAFNFWTIAYYDAERPWGRQNIRLPSAIGVALDRAAAGKYGRGPLALALFSFLAIFTVEAAALIWARRAKIHQRIVLAVILSLTSAKTVFAGVWIFAPLRHHHAFGRYCELAALVACVMLAASYLSKKNLLMRRENHTAPEADKA